MLMFVMALLLIWVGIQINMPIWYYMILTAAFLFDMSYAAYKAGKEDKE